MHSNDTGQHRPFHAPTNPAPVGAGAGGRRTLFGAVAALLVTPALAHTVPHDAALLACCEAFHEADALVDAGEFQSEEAGDEACARRWDIVDQIEGMVATTVAGRLAKGRVALVLMEENACSDAHDQFVLATLREWVGGAA